MDRAQQYSRDTQIEGIVSRFIDKHFWEKLCSSAVVVRHTDIQHQFAGIDVSLSTSLGVLNFDEKAKTYGCLNQPMTVLSFELSFINKNGQPQDGWLLRQTKTDYYSFIQLSATVDDTHLLSSDSQIEAASVTWVNKLDMKRLIAFYSGLSCVAKDIEALRDGTAGIRYSSGKRRLKYSHGKFWLTYSANLHEKSVNLVVPMEVLFAMSHTRQYIATREKIERVI